MKQDTGRSKLSVFGRALPESLLALVRLVKSKLTIYEYSLAYQAHPSVTDEDVKSFNGNTINRQTSVGLGRRFFCSCTWLPVSVNVRRLVQL